MSRTSTRILADLRNAAGAPPGTGVDAWVAAIPIMVTLIVLIPFLGKPFTIDDVTFLLEARHALSDPLHPAAFDMVSDGERIRLSRKLATGPVMAYLLVPVVKSASAEFLAHLIQLAFLVIAYIATTSLAIRLGLDRVQSVVAASLVVMSPAVLAMTSTAMPDVPALAFGAAGVERFVAWYQRGSWQRGISAAVFLGLSCLARSHAISLIPIAGLLAVSGSYGSRSVQGEFRRSAIRFAPLGGALLMVVSVVAVTRDPDSGVDLARVTAGRIEHGAFLLNLPSYMLHWALAFPLAVLWPFVRGRQFLVIARTCVSAVIASVLSVTAGYLTHGMIWGVVFLLLLTLSVDVLLDIAVDGLKRRDYVQLALFVWLLSPSLAAVYIQLPAKLLVFSAPAMGIVVARRTRLEIRNARQTVYLVAIGGVCLTLSVLIMRADQRLAQIGREGGAVVAQQIRSGQTVWSDGSWGFQWYSLRAGAQPMARTAPFPQRGDVIVSSLEGRLRARLYPRATLVSRKIFSAPGGRINGEGAGFYSNVVGPLPWVWGTKEFGRIEVWRVDSLK